MSGPAAHYGNGNGNGDGDGNGVSRSHRLSNGDHHAEVKTDRKLKLLAMSPTVLIDRVYLHTEFLPVLNRECRTTVWSDSTKNPSFRELWERTGADFGPFPTVAPLKGFPHSILRRVNDYAWDMRIPSASKQSMNRLLGRGQTSWVTRWAGRGARVVHLLGQEPRVERLVERLVVGHVRSPDARGWLEEHRPSAVFTTGPFQFNEPAVIAQAKAMGIPVIALIPSWDNLSTKNRLIFDYDAYIVWSEAAKADLHHFYPQSRRRPVHVVGAPQFDLFHQDRFRQSRDEFARSQDLEPNRPILVYAIGSPNFLKGEPQGALDFAKRVAAGDLGDAQLIVRPHPLHDQGEMEALFQGFAGQAKIQRPAGGGQGGHRGQDEGLIRQWVNTIRHADVLINLSSTVAIEAALCDRPVVNLDYDPAPGAPQQELIREVNHLWNHYRPVAESGGVWLTNDLDETVKATRAYLDDPGRHRDERRRIAEWVCGPIDGQASKRMAQAILETLRT